MSVHTPDPQRIRQIDSLSPLRERFAQTPPGSPLYQVKYKDYQSAIEAIAQLEAELSEFQQSSFELEKELEKELLDLEEANDALKEKNEQLSKELKELQRSRFEMEKQSQRAKDELSRTVKHLEDELEKKNTKLVDIEILNDSIEQSERNLNVSYQELEDKYFVSQEKAAILETEASEVRDQLFKEQLNHQNTKNELEDLQAKYEELLKKQAPPPPSSATAPPPHNHARSTSTSSMSRSTSLRQLHSMLENTKDMNSKIDNIKFSLNKSSNLKFNRIKSGTTTKISNTTITTTTPAASSYQTPSKAKKRIPLSPSSFKLSLLSGAKLNTMEVIEGSPNTKAEPPASAGSTKSLFGARLS